MTAGIWLASTVMVLACAFDMGMYGSRWGQARAWESFSIGLGLGVALLAVLGWFTLAGVYLNRQCRCDCPPLLQRWMTTAPRPRRETEVHTC